ncbi:MAG: cupin domain-containing protein [Rudaea sp.]
MSTLHLPALDPATVPERRGSGYPEPFRTRMGERVKRRLGEACGLMRVGVNLVTLGPNGQSALRHWHSKEEEFVYVLDGEVVLVTDVGEQVLRAGDCAGYPAGRPDAHHFVNRSAAPAKYLEVGTREVDDVPHYPDDDIVFVGDARDGYYAHRDGRRYE